MQSRTKQAILPPSNITTLSIARLRQFVERIHAITHQTSLKDNFSNDKARWDSLQQSLLGLYGKDVYTSWLQNISFTKINFNTLVLNVKTRFIRDWIVAHYADKILDLYKKQGFYRVKSKFN